MNLITVIIVGREKVIYSYDSVGFWQTYIDWGKALLRGDIIIILTGAWKSLEAASGYNWLVVLPLVPFYSIFGVTRVGYILAIVNVIAFPTVLVFAFFMKQLGTSALATDFNSGKEGSENDKINQTNIGRIYFCTALITMLTCSLFWAGILFDGLSDVIGILLMNVVYLIYFGKPIVRQSIRRLILIGCLLGLIMILRRWYTVLIAAFFVAVFFIDVIFPLLQRFSFSLFLQTKNRIGLLMIMGISTGVFVYALSNAFFWSLFSNFYSNATLAFKLPDHSLISVFLAFAQITGFGLISLTIVGFAISLFAPSIRRFTVFLIIQTIVAYFLFTRMQFFGLHHLYLVVPGMLTLTSFLISTVVCRIHFHSRIAATGAILLYGGISFFIMVLVFFPEANRLRRPFYSSIPDILYPRERNDLQEVQRLLTVLHSLVDSSKGGIYVLSSNNVLNGLQLRTAHLSFGTPPSGIENSFVSTAIADDTDGFPTNIFRSLYVVVTDPVIVRDRRKLIEIPTKHILNGTGFGRSYKRLPYVFHFISGVNVYIYQRVDSFSRQDIDDLSAELQREYPDQPNLFPPKYSEILLKG